MAQKRSDDDDRTLTGIETEEPTDPGIILPSPAPKKHPSGNQAPVNQANETQAPPQTTASATPIRLPDLGPLDPFMKDPSITEILVNDIRNVMIEKDGKMSFSGFTYQSLDDLNRLTRAILDFTGRILTPDHPFVDASLPDGARIHIVGPPLTLGGPCITIRKFSSHRPSIEDMIKTGTLDRRIAYFLNICVVGRMNILISGGTGTGKTTVLNALAAFIPKSERVVTIEDTPELALTHPNSVRVLTKPQSPTLAAITARDLLANALRMRPDRIIVGECRRGEALDMLQAMNTGHAGSMTTLHANSPRDALTRVETLALMGGVELPLVAIRKQMASAIDLVIQVKRFRNGSRKVVNVSELTGIEGDTLTLQDIFYFEADGKAGPDSPLQGTFKCTGLVPTFLDRLREQGLDFPQNYFG